MTPETPDLRSLTYRLDAMLERLTSQTVGVRECSPSTPPGCRTRHADFLWCLVAIVALQCAGCTTIGGFYSSDPEVKLQDAVWLYDRDNRPVPAEELIQYLEG